MTPVQTDSCAAAAALALSGICKSYGPVVAVAGVDLAIAQGEVVALVGDNGAGKSSLIKIISGAEQPSSGEIRILGEPATFAGPEDALKRGIATIYQDLALAPRLAVYENIFLGAELTRPLVHGWLPVLDKARMIAEARGLLEFLGQDIGDMRAPVERLSGGQRQAVSIARALKWNAGLIVMDEPTAALGVQETQRVLDVIRRLAADGRTVLMVSHSMDDVVAVATRVVVMKNARKIADRPMGRLRAHDIARIITTGEDVAV